MRNKYLLSCFDFTKTPICRYLKQWVMVWNGYDGRIYISSAFHLADQAFQPARVLVEKLTEEQKNWSASSFSLSPPLIDLMMIYPKTLTRVLRYPTLISESLGDRLGGEHLHLYWRDFHEGLGAGRSIFRSLTFWLSPSFSSVSFRKATLEIELNSTSSSPSTPVSTSLSVSTSTLTSASPITTTTTTTPGEIVP